jgi:hypothetical protein
MTKRATPNLVFLISQPRTGSTLLQRILGSHPDIHTQSEPWVLLHFLFPFRFEEIATPYNSWLYSLGLTDFINSLPGGKSQYKEAMANTFLGFYNAILSQKNKNLFLDKTPRYFHIISELLEFFPEARFVFLWRNPAAVIHSIAKTFTKQDWQRLSDFRHDLLFAPQKMLDGIEAAGSKAYSLQYEILLNNPEKELAGICRFLSIPFAPSMLQYGETPQTKWRFGDQQTVYQFSKPEKALTNSWIDGLKEPQTWRVINDYVQLLGEKLITAMGYDFDSMLQLVEQNRPDTNDIDTIGLEQLLENKSDLVIENFRLKKHLTDAKRNLQYNIELATRQKMSLDANEAKIIELEKLIKQKSDNYQ